MESARQDKVVVRADFVQSALVEGPVVDQAARLVYDDEGEYRPCYLPSQFIAKIWGPRQREWGNTHMMGMSFHGHGRMSEQRKKRPRN